MRNISGCSQRSVAACSKATVNIELLKRADWIRCVMMVMKTTIMMVMMMTMTMTMHHNADDDDHDDNDDDGTPES